MCGMGGCVFLLLLRMSSSFLPFVAVVHLTKMILSSFNWKGYKSRQQSCFSPAELQEQGAAGQRPPDWFSTARCGPGRGLAA